MPDDGAGGSYEGGLTRKSSNDRRLLLVGLLDGLAAPEAAVTVDCLGLVVGVLNADGLNLNGCVIPIPGVGGGRAQSMEAALELGLTVEGGVSSCVSSPPSPLGGGGIRVDWPTGTMRTGEWG